MCKNLQYEFADTLQAQHSMLLERMEEIAEGTKILQDQQSTLAARAIKDEETREERGRERGRNERGREDRGPPSLAKQMIVAKAKATPKADTARRGRGGPSSSNAIE